MQEFLPYVLVNQAVVIHEIVSIDRLLRHGPRTLTVEHRPGEPIVIPSLPNEPIPADCRPLWKSSLGKIMEEVVKLQLEASYATIIRMLESLDDSECPMSYLADQANELHTRMVDELNYRTCFAIWRDKEKLYAAKLLFGDDVAKNFPSASVDIEEAAKCLALDRGTAAVFHLMRVMEVGLRALAKSLNDPRLDPKKNPTWSTILQKGDEELKKPIAQRAPEWAAHDHFFSEAQANLRVVQYAWRNPTMHVEINYDPEKASDVMQSVKAFMRHLASKLQE
jgi:hypothetical protein